MFRLEPGDRALVIATHPDDESLGLGGTIAHLTAAGITVDVLAVTCPSDADARTAEFGEACAVLGVTGHQIIWTGGPQAADPGAHLAELITAIEQGPKIPVEICAPRLVFIPSRPPTTSITSPCTQQPWPR